VASTVDALTFDCADPRLLARFWTEVLGYELSDIDEDGAEIVDPAGEGWRLLFLAVPEGKAVKNRVHLDLRPPESMAEEVERAVELGATVFRYVEEHGSFWTVMRDPGERVLRAPGSGRWVDAR
jgi:hypothetical protein